jgi:hypothetical protein
MIFSWKKIGFSLGVILGGMGFFFSFVAPVFAQTIPDVSSYDSSINEGDFSLEVTPENPAPFDTVTIRIGSDLVDTNRYPITWTVDGAVVLSGIGKRSLSIKMKDYGQTTSVTFSIQIAQGVVQKKISFTPQDTTILWEAADSYVPPFYEGKKLPSYESLVRITAIPNFLSDKRSFATKNAVYNWSRNKSVVSESGGYGKDSLLIEHNRVRTTEFIEVDASATSGSATAHARITIPFYEPKILFYEKNIVSGITSPLAKTSLFFTTESTTIRAVPYFFSVVRNNPNSLKFSWTMNDKAVSLTDRNKDIITLQRPEASGSAKLGLSVENTLKLFQSAQNSLSILFKK